MTQEQIREKLQKAAREQEKNQMEAKSTMVAEEDRVMPIVATLRRPEVVEVKSDEVAETSPEVAVADTQSEQVPAPVTPEEPREEVSEVKTEETTDITGDSTDAENEESAKETPELSNDNLPVIQPTDKKAMLCVRDGYALIIMPVFNAESLVVENCKLYLQNFETGMVHIGAGSELKIDKSKLLDATDHGVMRVLRKFTVNFTEDDMKLAFERAKIFMENIKTMVAVSSSMTIQQAYVEVVNFAIEKAKQEKGAKVMEKDIHCKYNEKEQIVSVRDNYLQDVLDEVGAGFTKTIFCKKLCLLEAHYGVSLVIRNKGRYSCNEAGNTRFYKFNLVDELLNTGGAA